MKSNVKFFLGILFFLFSAETLFGQAGQAIGASGAGAVGSGAGRGSGLSSPVTPSEMSHGEKLFKENHPAEAAEVLENEIWNGMVSENSYNFLGLAYYQIGEYEKSIDAFNRGMKTEPSNMKTLYFNQGNTYYAMADYDSASACYSAALKLDNQFYEAMLNKANALLMGDKLKNSKELYEQYQALNPQNVQKEKIDLLIQALADEIARREELERLERERNKPVWEVIDPTISEKKDAGPEWEEVDATISEKENRGPDWEEVDATITERENRGPKWEQIDAAIKEEPKVEVAEDSDNEAWEEFENERPADPQKGNARKNENWEAIDQEPGLAGSGAGGARSQDNLVTDAEHDPWEALDLSDEIEALDQLSIEEYRKWQEDREKEEERKRIQKLLEEEDLARKKLESEQKMRQELLDDMMAAEEAKRKKLLEDVANSLQNSGGGRSSEGADDIIDYESEGELD